MSVPALTYSRMPVRLPHNREFSRRCLYFDGIEDNVDFGFWADLNTDRFTIEYFLKVIEAESEDYDSPAYRDNNLWETFIDVQALPPRWRHGYYFNIGGAPIFRTGGRLRYGEWYHFFVEYDGSDITQYVNCIYDISDPAAGAVHDAFNQPLLLMENTDLPLWLNGYMNHFRFYTRALTQAERWHNMLNYNNPVADGLVLWAAMEEGQGLTAFDSSVGGHNGTLNPAPTPPLWARVQRHELRAESEG